mmetsp:Transcript_4039/g.9765  ORF Transcript_4039/g.9765 Transcript_4039/m.9765 type:complete len:366 (-) Transcript_4039:4335-5432(-)
MILSSAVTSATAFSTAKPKPSPGGDCCRRTGGGQGGMLRRSHVCRAAAKDSVSAPKRAWSAESKLIGKSTGQDVLSSSSSNEEATPSNSVVVVGESCPANAHFIWQSLCAEAKAEADEEPALASYLFSTILAHRSLEDALAFVLANKLRSNVLLDSQLLEMFSAQYRRDKSIVKSAQADMQAVMDRDPACEKYLQILLFFKGFQAIQAYRVAAALWRQDRKPLALLLQSRISEVFHVDVHPGATLGVGLMFDHATGVVIGETAVVGDNVSLLHGVTLGGTGTKEGDRHPKIGAGVVIGAGVTVLGNITIGENSKIGAGSVVLREIPPNCTAVGIPARLVGRPKPELMPSLSMDQVSGLSDYTYNI